MRREPAALAALGLLDLGLLVGWQHLGVRLVHSSSALVLTAALASIVLARSATLARPASGPFVNSVNAAGIVMVVAAVMLPVPHMVALLAAITLAENRSAPLVRALGNFLLHLAAGLSASVVSSRLMSSAPSRDLAGTSAACLAAAVALCLVSAVLVSLLSRFVDDVPFRQQVIWHPEHYARAQAFDLLGSLTAFLLLVSPWALLFVGAPQLLLVGLLLKDAGSSAAADQDAKTGLLNHPALVARGRAELGRAARHDEPVSLLVLDLDHLREINNRHGHPVGDLAIAAVADVLRRSVRAHDLAARVGGEEFLVLLPATDLAAAVDVAERIRTCLAAQSLPARSGPVSVTTSVGAAQVEAGEAWESLYERADRALLLAKESGRDRVEVAVSFARE